MVFRVTLTGMIHRSTHLETEAVHAGREDLTELGVHAPPIDLSSTNPLPDIDSGGAAYEALAGGGRPPGEGGLVYARLWNPTVARFEDALARLEHADEAVAFASGMAAVSAAILAFTGHSRRHVVAVRPLYGGTDHVLGTGLLGTETTFCAADEVAAHVRPRWTTPSPPRCCRTRSIMVRRCRCTAPPSIWAAMATWWAG